MSISTHSKKTKAITIRLLTLGMMLAWVSAQAAKTTPEDFGIELQNKVTAEVLVSIRPLPGGHLEYGYTLKNSALSKQNILNFRVQVKVPVSSATAEMTAAPGWFLSGRGNSVDRTLDDGSIKTTIGWLGEDIPTLIKPGESLSGFRLIVKSIPGIQDFQVQGYTDKDMAKIDLFEEEMDVLGDLQDAFKGNSFKGKTIGPDPAPEVVNLAELLDRLIFFKHQAAALNWISGPGSDGIVKSLDAKLDAAKAAIARGQNKTAANQLNAFVNELRTRRGKHFSDNAFFLLKINAEFILSKLGA